MGRDGLGFHPNTNSYMSVLHITPQLPRGYIRSETSVHFMNYHIVWSPKYRYKLLVGDVEKRLRVLLREKCSQLGIDILSLEIMSDHIHIFVRASPIIAPNNIVASLKGYTSRILRQEFPELRSRLPTLWTRSYFISSYGKVSAEMIEKYIEEQQGRITK